MTISSWLSLDFDVSNYGINLTPLHVIKRGFYRKGCRCNFQQMKKMKFEMLVSPATIQGLY
jgi:hypothetical protein